MKAISAAVSVLSQKRKLPILFVVILQRIWGRVSVQPPVEWILPIS